MEDVERCTTSKQRAPALSWLSLGPWVALNLAPGFCHISFLAQFLKSAMVKLFASLS